LAPDRACSRHELHRNSVAFGKQGNRNPLIDFPELVDRIDFESGLGD
jgi:endonuclease I